MCIYVYIYMYTSYTYAKVCILAGNKSIYVYIWYHVVYLNVIHIYNLQLYHYIIQSYAIILSQDMSGFVYFRLFGSSRDETPPSCFTAFSAFTKKKPSWECQAAHSGWNDLPGSGHVWTIYGHVPLYLTSFSLACWEMTFQVEQHQAVQRLCC